MDFTPVFAFNAEEVLEDDCNSPLSAEEGIDEFAPASLCHSHGGSPTMRAEPFRAFPSDYPDIETRMYYLDQSPISPVSQWAPRVVNQWISTSHLPEEYGSLIHPQDAYAACSPSELSPDLALGDLESPIARNVSKKTTAAKKKFKCPLTDCGVYFARKADKERHYHCVHRRDLNKHYDCDVKDCTRRGNSGFTRRDHLREHKRNFHHQVIPKRPKVHRKRHNH